MMMMMITCNACQFAKIKIGEQRMPVRKNKDRRTRATKPNNVTTTKRMIVSCNIIQGLLTVIEDYIST